MRVREVSELACSIACTMISGAIKASSSNSNLQANMSQFKKPLKEGSEKKDPQEKGISQRQSEAQDDQPEGWVTIGKVFDFMGCDTLEQF